jgi:hypothetical protein
MNILFCFLAEAMECFGPLSEKGIGFERCSLLCCSFVVCLFEIPEDSSTSVAYLFKFCCDLISHHVIGQGL